MWDESKQEGQRPSDNAKRVKAAMFARTSQVHVKELRDAGYTVIPPKNEEDEKEGKKSNEVEITVPAPKKRTTKK